VIGKDRPDRACLGFHPHARAHSCSYFLFLSRQISRGSALILRLDSVLVLVLVDSPQIHRHLEEPSQHDPLEGHTTQRRMPMQDLHPFSYQDVPEKGKVGQVLRQGSVRCQGDDGKVVDLEGGVEVPDTDSGCGWTGRAGVGDDNDLDFFTRVENQIWVCRMVWIRMTARHTL
jgi:hypothetical protein